MISCHKHDCIEIASMYRFHVRLILKTGEDLDGVACDTQLNGSRDECLELKVGDDYHLVVLDNISRMEAKKTNPHFDAIEFE